MRRGIKENISSELVYNKDNIQLQHSRDTVYLNIIGDNTGLEDENQSTTTYTRYLEYRGAHIQGPQKEISAHQPKYTHLLFLNPQWMKMTKLRRAILKISDKE